MIIPITVDTTDKDLEELLESSEENMCSLSGRQSRPYLETDEVYISNR